MAENSNIEWTHHTFNPWIGCTKVSSGCKNCYAEELMDARYQKTKWGPNGLRVIKAESGWKQPLKWDKLAAAAGERHRVFCASLADVFEGPETMPDHSIQEVRAARLRMLKIIYSTPNLDWLLLTKRPQNIKRLLLDAVSGEWADPGDLTDKIHAWVDGTREPHNVWLGTSVEDQKTANERIPHLLSVAASVRFLSMEPMLGPVSLSAIPPVNPYAPCSTDALTGTTHWPDGDSDEGPKIDWVIVGGESGTNARPMHPEWARGIRDECAAAEVPFLMKQWGEWEPCNPCDKGTVAVRLSGEIAETIGGCDMVRGSFAMRRVGKKAAGRLLDGVEHNGYPNSQVVKNA